MRNFIQISILCSLLFFYACTEEEDVSPEGEAEVTSAVVQENTFATEMLAAVNKLRVEGCTCGTQEMPPVEPLNWDQILENTALRHAQDMEVNKVRSHTGSDESSVSDRAREEGYKGAVGENIGWDWTDLNAIVEAWENSPGHCRNMMNAKYVDFGAAREGNNWVQVFGIP